MDFIESVNGKVATLVKREPSWWGDLLTWNVDDNNAMVLTNTNSSHEFKNAEPGVKGVLHWHTMNFWYAKPVELKGN